MKNREQRRHPAPNLTEVRALPPSAIARLRDADMQVAVATQQRLLLATGVLVGMGLDLSDDAPTAWGIDTDKGVAIGTPKEPQPNMPPQKMTP